MGVSFDNCLIQAPDGQNLSRCGKKKVDWYVSRNLADIVDYDPLTIRLRFEPRGREGTNDPLLMNGKPNLCVVCGCTEDLTRHHIIPYCYIKYMEVKYKVDVVRDIFLLCEDCHGEYERIAFERKKQWAKDLGIPVCGVADEELRNIRRAMGAAAALQKYSEKIPEDRKQELTQIVCEFVGKDEITAEDLQTVRDHKIKERPDYFNISKTVAYSVDDYNEFAKDWRIHFIKTMKPQHMPDAWKIDRDSESTWIPRRLRDQKRRT